MKFRKFAPVASIVSLRDALRDSAKKPNKKRYLEFFAGELEKRQLLATFGYNSGTGLLTIQTDSANEQLSIISTSGSGNYTITTTGSWSGSASNITASGASLYVNQPSGLASILVNDNNGTVSGSSFGFGSSSANFVSNLTVSFSNGSSSISVGNATTFAIGNNLSLTSSSITLAQNITTAAGNVQNYTGNLILAGGNRTLTGSSIQITGTTNGGGNALTITGNLLSNGSMSNLTNLSVSGTSNLTGTVSTNGTQTFTGNLTVNGALTLLSNGNAVRVDGQVISLATSGAFNLTSFTAVGNSTFTVPAGVTMVDVLIVAGGGGGTLDSGGGGGGGQVRELSNVSVSGTVNVVVGAGGAGTFYTGSTGDYSGGAAGGNSTFGSYTSGGGGGGVSRTGNYNNGYTGGGGVQEAYSVKTGYGNISGGQGRGFTSTNGGGGGGGAGGNGVSASSSSGGAGGIGIISNITGTPTYYGGGGGGAVDTSTSIAAGAGGLGGGGGGSGGLSGNSLNGANGTVNTGGGGGGGTNYKNGGNGGSGVVIVRVNSSPNLSSFTINAGAGSVALNGAVGAGTALTSMNITASNISLGSVNATSLTLNSTAAALSVSDAITVSGTASITAAGGISLANATNNFGTVTACGTNITIADTNALTLGSIAGNGTVQITAQNLTITSTVNATSSGSVLLIPTSGTMVALGTKSTGNFGLTSAEISNITAQSLTIGNSTTGNIAVTSAVNVPANVSLALLACTTSSCISVGSALSVSGTGGISMSGRNIVVTGNISSQAGDITLYGNGGGSYQAGSFEGVCISGSTVNVNTTGGNITIDGRGGLNTACSGVNLQSSKVEAGGAGCVTLTGLSGNGTTAGIGIYLVGSTVTTSSGSISVNGTACSTGGASASRGVCLTSSSKILATGAGDVTITGTAYGYSYSYAVGVSNSCVTTSSGSITVNGTSCSPGVGSSGVYLRTNANISATGAGNVTITGTANGTTGVVGVTIYQNSKVSTSSGSLTVIGTSCATGTGSMGVYLTTSASILATGAGNVTITGSTPGNISTGSGIYSISTGDKIGSSGGLITLTANSVNLTGTVNSTFSGNVVIQTLGAGVNLGGADSAANLGLTSAEIGQITANRLTIGNSTQGNIFVTSAVSVPANVSLALLACTTSSCISVGSSLSVTGTGAISLTGRNIGVSGSITSGSGNITLNGNGNGSYQSGSFRGVDIAASVCATSGGSISVSGVAGSSGGEGVYVSQPVIASNGAISITGDANVGKGIAVQGASATIIANGTNGSVTLTAYSGTTGETRGMDFWDNSRVNTSDGPITLVGTSRSNVSDSAVWVEGNANVTAGNAGTVTVTGYNGGQTVKIDGKLASSGGLVSINGDKVYIGNTANVTSTSAGSLSIQPTTANKAISIGGGDSSTNLGVDQSELNRLTTGCLTIGGATAGNISLASSVTWGTNVTLFSALPINGTLSNSSHTFTQGSYTLTATGTIATNTFDPYQVTTTADSGAGSLRSIVTLAASNPGNDVISFSSSLAGSTITLATPITINDSSGNVTITGLGSGNLTIGGSGTLFTVQSNATLTGMTFTNTLTSTTNLTLSNVATSYATAVTQTGGSLTINSSNIVNSVVIAGGANYTVVGGTLGSAVSISNGNQVSITGLSQNITLGSINAGGLTVTTNTTTNAISVTGPVAVTGSGAISLTGRNIVVTGNITSQAGDITLYGNGGGSYQAGTFDGVQINGAAVNVNTTGGSIAIDGRGGLNTACAGVNMTSSKVQAGGVGSVTITGVSGNGSTNNAYGIYTGGACLTVSDGNISFNGTGCGTGQSSIGANLNTNSRIAATGQGGINFIGTVGCGTNTTVGVFLSGACVTIANGNLTMNGNGAFGTSNVSGINIYTSCISSSNGMISLTGTANGTINGSRGVITDTSNISMSGNSNLTITGNAIRGTDNAYGIALVRSNVTVANGTVTANGTANGSSRAIFGSEIWATNLVATGSGTFNITGLANGTTSANDIAGVDIYLGSKLTTNNGSIFITGESRGQGALNNTGVWLEDSANITACGSGTVNITGVVSNSSQIGIVQDNANGKIWSTGGVISLTANSVCLPGTVNATTSGNVLIQTLGAGVNLGGADSAANLGLTSAEIGQITANLLTIGNSTTGAIVNTAAISRANLTLISGNSITQTGAGNLSISGTANFVSSGTGTAGNITLSNATNDFGTVTASGTNLTIADTNALTMGSIAGNGTVQITAQNVTITSTVNATVSGSVVLIPKSGTVVDLGTKSTGNFGLTSTEIGNITANLLTIGNSTAGAIVNTAAISRANLTLISGNSITQTGAGNLTISGTANFVSSGTGTAGNITLNNATNDFGTVRANGTNITIYDSNNLTIGAVTANGDFAVQGDNTTSCISVTGPVNATGGSGNISLTGRNIVVTGNILTAAGGISLIGNNGTYQSGTFDGVQISGAAVNVNTTGGSILIDGRGGFNTVNAGVNLTSSKVQAGGAGCVTISGVSGNGSANYAYGIYACGSTVTTSTGSITVNGTSCGTGTSSFGLYQTTSANISATGAGNVTITGTAANGTNSACGIYIYNYSIVTTNNGTLTINGTSNGTGTGARGVDLSYQSNISATGAGNVSITGTAANGTTSAYGIYISQTPVTTSSGAITINGTSCGTGTDSRGVVLAYGTTNISATGAGNVTITGRASGTFDASGILVRSSAKVSTSTGTLTVNGTSCGTQATSRGVCLDDSANISATGAGNVTITGTAANGTIDAYGIFLQSSPKITSSTGKLTVNGTSCGTGTGARGVYLKTTANISATGAGEVTITGSTPGNLSTGVGFLSFDSGSKVYANGGLITLTANSVNMTGTVNATSVGNVLIQTFGSGVNLGNGTDTSANLGLSQSELNKITANQLIIGDRATNATISLTQNMSWSSNLSIRSNLPISGILSNSNHTFTQGSNTLTATGTILLDSPTVNYTVLVSSNSPVTYGTSVLLTASLTHSGSAFNTGTISFYNNGVLLGSGNITNDVANYTWSGASAGTYANITATGLVPGGTDNGSNTASVVVNQANLTITANNAAKTYDANAFTGGNGVSYSGFVGSENSTVLSGTLVYGGNSQGAVNAGSYTITPSNLTSSNYNITFANGSLTVATAPLTITANGAIKNYGSDLSGQMGLQTSGYTSTGLQGSDTVTNVTLASTGAAPTANIGSYTITPSAANSAALANYNITYANGSLTVNQANLTITSSNNSKQYGLSSPLNNATGFTNGTMYNGDTIASVNLVSSGTSLTANVGSYGITASSASLAATGVGNISNYNITYASTGSLSVTQAPMTLTADNRTKRYGDSLTLGTTCFTLSGTLYNGDTITNATLTASQAANTSAPIGNYPIAPSAAVAGNTGVGNISNYNINYTNGTLAVWESLSTTVTSSSDISNPFDDQITLREAIDYGTQLTGNRTISFAQSIFSANTTTITLTQGVLAVNDNSGTLNIQGPLVSSANRLTVSGGNSSGIFSLATPTILSNMTLSGGNAGTGAAIFNNATTSLTGLTIQDNAASANGAGIYNDNGGQLTATLTTFANNTAVGDGGAVYNNGGMVSLSQSTIAFNAATTGGGIKNYGGTANLLNTIVANNTGYFVNPDVAGNINANYSLIGNSAGAVTTGSNNLQDVTALIGSLNDYGGTTKVYPLLPGSPAINAGFGSNATDQRGITVAGTADIGSFQSRGFNITRTGGNCQTAMIGDAFPANLSLSVASSYSEPVNGGVITFTAPVGNVPSATIAGSTTISGGNVSLQATANAYYGSTSNQNYNITANAAGAVAGTNYQLLNVGTPSTVNITSGNNQSGSLTGNFAQTLGINVKDSVGNNIPRLAVTFTPNTSAYGATGNIAGQGNGLTYTGTTDGNGNITGLTYASNGIGGLVTVIANATVAQIPGVRPQATSTANFYEGAVGMTIQNGTAGRSFVNSAAIMVGNATLASFLLTSGRAVLQFLGYSGTSNATAAAGVANISASSGNLVWNYGTNGITGNANSQNGDGVYQLAVDYNGDGRWTYVKFHRLFGDVNGDGVVDTTDYNVVINPTVYAKTNITSGANTNGQGQVYTKDVTTVLRQRGRRVAYNVY